MLLKLLCHMEPTSKRCNFKPTPPYYQDSNSQYLVTPVLSLQLSKISVVISPFSITLSGEMIRTHLGEIHIVLPSSAVSPCKCVVNFKYDSTEMRAALTHSRPPRTYPAVAACGLIYGVGYTRKRGRAIMRCRERICRASCIQSCSSQSVGSRS